MTTMNTAAGTQSNVLPSPTLDGRTGNKRFEEQAKKTVQDFQEVGGMAKDVAHEKLGDIKETASEYLKQGQEKAEEVGHSIEQLIKENPIKFLLIAAGVGIIFGRFFMRQIDDIPLRRTEWPTPY